MDARELLRHWTEVRQGLLAALDCVNDAQLGFIPHPGLWSMCQTVCHIAGAEEGWLRYAVTRELDRWPDDDYQACEYPTVAGLKALLQVVHHRTDLFFAHEIQAAPDLQAVMERKVCLPWGGETSVEWVTWHLIEHEIHHRGEIYLMLGLQGITAPDV